MPAYLEVWRPSGPELEVLTADRATIGKDPANDIVLTGDRLVSRMHAVMERFAAGWLLHDAGSRNGTFVNGERIAGERVLRPRDELRMGVTRLIFREDPGVQGLTATEGAQAAPSLTRRERDVLLALCRPVLAGTVFTQPASVKQIATELVVSEAAVKQHLLHLYDKFRIYGDAEGRRAELANEAINRAAVTLADLRSK